MMTEFTFFLNRAERWKKDLVTLWGNLEICPHLNCLELPSHSPVELTSISRFKVWGNTQDPCQDMAYLLVCLGNTIEGIQYGVSLVWVNPKQARAPMMEEVVEKLTTYPSSRTNWPYILVQLYEGFGHALLPKGKHLGILPQGKVEETSCGQISHLDVCQFLSTSPQVVYPSGLNGKNEPIITTLSEPLRSSISMLSSEHPYLEIDIPPKGESDAKVLPMDEVSITQTTNPPESSYHPEGSMATEVNHLLDQAMVETSNGRSKQFSLERIMAEDPPQKSEATTPLIDTSSQASAQETEESSEDIPANISLIATIYSSGSASPLVDPSELQANVNRVIDNMLHLKRSLDIKRQTATWELGGLLH